MRNVLALQELGTTAADGVVVLPTSMVSELCRSGISYSLC
jgi:hypothetical protein